MSDLTTADDPSASTRQGVHAPAQTPESVETARTEVRGSSGATKSAAPIVPTVLAQDLWVKFLIRYHRTEITLRETLIRTFDRGRRSGQGNGRWRQVFWALRGISLLAYPGDVVGIIGQNGGGKTTLLKSLAGILGADRGSVMVRGKVSCLLSFGVGFNPHLSGRENIYLNGSILGLRRRTIDERFDDIVAFSELGDFIHAPVRTYSAGMKGRLGFSIAVHIDPDVLLLDEVLTVGDASFRAKAGSILDRYRGSDKTVVLASHSMDLIRNQCTKAYWIAEGKVQMEGTPEEVTGAYETHSKGPAKA
ncbi:MAG: ABC transporter ATP-binding protein [Phycisphaerae bacterium]|nr:ABC transporter ATP-binding protein [Phycisphaerae bacterium]